MVTAESLGQAWEKRARSSAIEPAMTITEAGLVLGAGTMLATRRADRGDRPALDIEGNEERIHALLSVAYGRAVDPAIIDHIRRASQAYRRGETCLALIHLAHAGLPALPDRKTGSYCLFLANELFEAGVAPHDLLDYCGLEMGRASERKAGFNPGQPRVPAGGGRESGRWADAAQPEIVPTAARQPAIPDEYRTGDPDKFFDTVYSKIHALAQRLGIDETWLLGLAAHESGYLDGHNRALNDPFGVTHGGGPNVAHSSIDAAISYWERRFGPIVQGATNGGDFVNRLFAAKYHANAGWRDLVLKTIRSIPRRLATWKAKRGF